MQYHTVIGLTNGTSYSFEVRAVATTGMTPASDAMTATPTALPASPIFDGKRFRFEAEKVPVLTAAAKNEGVLLTWVPGNWPGIRSWQFQQKAGTGSYGKLD